MLHIMLRPIFLCIKVSSCFRCRIDKNTIAVILQVIVEETWRGKWSFIPIEFLSSHILFLIIFSAELIPDDEGRMADLKEFS